MPTRAEPKESSPRASIQRRVDVALNAAQGALALQREATAVVTRVEPTEPDTTVAQPVEIYVDPTPVERGAEAVAALEAWQATLA